MQLQILKPRQSLNKAFLKVKPSRSAIEQFKVNLITLLDSANETESEEFHKNLLSRFLHDTYYAPQHFINTKGRNDQVIHNGAQAGSTVGVIIEAKKPTNKAEMLSAQKINTKAFQELVLYYLRERITHHNLEIKHLVATNLYEWYIFDATQFDRLFAQHKTLVQQFTDFEQGRLADTRTDFFYKQIAEPFIAQLHTQIDCTYIQLQDYQKTLRNSSKADDNALIALYKILSPEHLLKLPFANDSNSLDKRFYAELLHIIGLTETKEGSKKLIGRHAPGQRHSGTLLEDAIIQLDSLDKLNQLPKPGLYGNSTEERLFAVALELCITWINRILFLKLLEAQLISYHKGDTRYAFLQHSHIRSYDDLNSLFFQVLARRHADRNADVQAAFAQVPYLNSSLFEPTDTEQATLFISNLKDDKSIPLHPQTVLKDAQAKKRSGQLNTLQYLFEFLNAYDFSSEGSEDIQEDNKTLINASVLGLIFEKINGYKDGSFFTPGFITMYMCRQTIRKAVLQKFNEVKQWQCQSLDELYNHIEDTAEANRIVNSLKICDPAVGSGHFLVSALNEMIAIKNDLKILQDRQGKRLKEYQIEVVNDELIVTDDNGELYEYNPNSKESQRVQEALFHEKQTIIENCLFGVDINANSVKICRLRLWIELLKNAYYKNATELETLPNIDINIKCGNSLVSRFGIDADLKLALSKTKINISDYKNAVIQYKHATNKEEKRHLHLLIEKIKSDFISHVSREGKLYNELSRLKQEYSLHYEGKLFNQKLTRLQEHIKQKKEGRIKKLQEQVDNTKNNSIFENAFEWRFEFPEVLNDDGDYVGFDTIIANPPYLKVQDLEHKLIDWYKQNKRLANKRIDISVLFFELAHNILKPNGNVSFISSNQFLVTEYGRNLRETLLKDFSLNSIVDFGDLPIFEDALTYVSIFNVTKTNSSNFRYIKIHSIRNFTNEILSKGIEIDISKLSSDNWVLSTNENKILLEKLNTHASLSSIGKCSYGIVSGADNIFIVDENVIRKENLERELLLPLIRANNCKRYHYANFDLHIIYPYKLENGFTILLPEEELRNYYPKTYQYLFSKKKALEERKDSRTTFADSNKWYSLTRFGQLEIFGKEKIVFPGEQKITKFSIDRNKSGYSGARVFAITLTDPEVDLKYLLGILNSKLIAFIIKSTFPIKAGGYFSMSSTFVDKLPIMKPSMSVQEQIANLISEILKQERSSNEQMILEKEVDKLIYQLYELTEEEIQIIENA
ncbi:DUF7149 domain-containing protein [Phnomibacter ginsenosidimutans]|uniref:site-specific DNA-methyltransferase (adenine-specific) n=1 Tax=Phnomibacter ginsenosidimutans TaxID=2676868 RepID=A0A6I6GHJ1_9BACT|nr:TaqI-like C-terminal specificity domain-containing protein [Phnomibacter ginsenosidimutans]QGW27168.1 type II restriction endonuclease [Phnomibacter ginsenosidimutans]